MDSDSDSDGSHVSATPPRDSHPRLSAARALRQTPIPSKNTKMSSGGSPKKPPSTRKAKGTHNLPRPLSNPSPLSSSLPFQILSPSSKSCEKPELYSVETIPAGFFSKFQSFSRFRRDRLSFETDEQQIERETNGANLIEPSRTVPEQVKVVWKNRPYLIGDSINKSSFQKVISDPTKCAKRKQLNFVDGESASLPAKVRKSGGNDNNFVRLNLTGKRRKFPSKCIKNSKHCYKFRKGRNKNLKAEKGSEAEILCEDDGLVQECMFQNQKQEEDNSVSQAVENALLAARDDPSDENLVRLLRAVYGYDSFRDGQKEAIKMVLTGKSTMLVLPTGAGKSLCYQIPAMILPGITVVVSPLVALMIDQLKHLPSVIRGGLISSSQRADEVTEMLRQLKEGMIQVLYVSPERFMREEFFTLLSATVAVSLVVVDEAHCVSEWSHNFRPSYLRLRASMLQRKLKAKCVLAMTATATCTTLGAVMSALEIPSTNLVQKTQIRDNLHLSISLSGTNRMKELLKLIKSSPFVEVQSIIIYCKFQSETYEVSKYLRDNNVASKSYHSGLPMKDRKYIQETFCANKIRVVVATVAFGMGLDKKDVGAVIHYSVPESLEEYVQEVGRAGRDGRSSYCHLFYDDNTYFKLRSLMHSEGVDEYTISKFIQEVFSVNKNSTGKVCSMVKESASRKFDMKEEVMLTLLTYLELSEVQYLCLLPEIKVTCALNFHQTGPDVLAKKDGVIAAILKKSEIKRGLYVFDIPTLASSLRVSAVEFSNQLQSLKMKGEITYDLRDPAFCYTVVEHPKDVCSLSEQLTNWLSEIEKSKIKKLDAMSDAAVYALRNCDGTRGCQGAQHSPCLQERILCYFKGEANWVPRKMIQSSPFLRADIKVFLRSSPQTKFTPRAVARIMHGITSPAYPFTVWSKTHFWGRYVHLDFQAIMEAAKAELLNFIGKEALELR